MTQQPINYSKGTKFFHWTIAIIVIGLLTFTFFIEDLPKDSQKFAFMIHKSLGLTVLALMICRIVWIRHTGRPALPEYIPVWERYLARFVQYSFYFLLLVMSLTGWIMSVAKNRVPSYFNLFEVPFPGIPLSDNWAGSMALIHDTIAYVLIGLVCFHIAGALKHHFMDKDDVLRRMLPGK